MVPDRFWTTLLFWSIALFFPPFSHADSTEKAEDLESAYQMERVEGTLKVKQSFLNSLQLILKERMNARDLEGANQTNELIALTNQELKDLAAGEYTQFVPPGEEESPELPEDLTEVIERHDDWFRRGIRQLNEKHVALMSAAQEKELGAGNLGSANAIELAKKDLEKELEAIERLRLEAEIAEQLKQPVVLFDESLRKNWKELNGKWSFRGNRLRGEGVSEIEFTGTLVVPFTLTWTQEVKKGQRPRLYIHDFMVAHYGYDFELFLHPIRPGQKNFPYKLNRKIDVKLTVEADYVELQVEDEVIDRRVTEMPPTIESLRLSGGDGFSPGISEFTDLIATPILDTQ
ncbi:MAG: hypothetical protein AAGF67_07130 [Verrucomicrobiota bacterium]